MDFEKVKEIIVETLSCDADKVTPEATLAVAQRQAPGIAEAIRAASLRITPRAMLGRGVSVIRGKTLIINLPESAKMAKDDMEYILPEIVEAVETLSL